MRVSKGNFLDSIKIETKKKKDPDLDKFLIKIELSKRIKYLFEIIHVYKKNLNLQIIILFYY